MTETLVTDIIPQNDAQRIEALRRYNILDTPPEESFNNIVRLIAEVFDTPIALISLVDKERVFFKGNVGMPGVSNVERSVSLCSFAVLSDKPTVFEKPLEEPCLLANPLVHGEFGLRFYAAAPLTTADGFNIGSVCIVDKKERSFSSASQEVLVRFAKMVMNELELRQSALKQKEAEEALEKSMERFELVTKATQDAIWDWNLVTDEVTWNEGVEKLFGYAVDENVGKAQWWYDHVHPEDRDAAVNELNQVLAIKGNVCTREYRFRCADGSYKHVLDRGFVQQDEAGKYFRMIGSMQDISDRKEAEAIAANQALLIQTIANNTTSTLFMMDEAGYCTFINSTGERMLGYRLEELRQKPMHDLIHHHHPDGSTYPRADCPLENALRNNLPIQTHRELFFRKDGSSFPASCAASPVFRNGDVVSAVIEIRDITLEVEAEQLLQRSAIELELLVQERTNELRLVNEQLKQFTYAASHDLQEPLRKISFFLDRLINNLGPTLNEEDKRNAERIQHTAERMRSLINDLLAYSNTTLGMTGFKEVDLTEIVNEVVEDMEATIIEKGAVIQVQELPKVKGDQRQLRQLFQNLISNALKYHRKETAPQVLITYQLVNREEMKAFMPGERKETYFYLIKVSDKGIGFDPDDADRIFRLFQRLHGKAEYEGTGVGLAIVQKVMENHKGYVWAESEPGEGATFNLLLPA